MAAPIQLRDRVFVNAIGFGEVVGLVATATVLMLDSSTATVPVELLLRDGKGYAAEERRLDEAVRRKQNAIDGVDGDGYPLPEEH